jgi:hypothetical protein
MGSKKSPPPPPDPKATADAQAAYNKDTGAYNAALARYNTYTPFGNQTWSQNGTDPTTGAPNYSQQISLTPQSQAALDSTQKTQAGLGALQGQALTGVQQTLNGNPFDQSNLPQRPIAPGQTAQQAIMSRLQPQMDLQNKQFDSDQANRGIPVGSEAYDAAHRSLSQGQNDLMSQAALQGIGLDQSNRQNAIQEQGYYANAPLNYLNGLMTGSQVQTPQFQATQGTSIQAPNYQQAVGNNYQGQLNAYNSQTGSSNSMMSGLFSLGGAALGAPAGTFPAIGAALGISDRRLKTDIRKVGKTDGGHNLYAYRYKASPAAVHIGVMADEVEHVLGAVHTMPDGFKAVDYSKVT